MPASTIAVSDGLAHLTATLARLSIAPPDFAMLESNAAGALAACALMDRALTEAERHVEVADCAEPGAGAVAKNAGARELHTFKGLAREAYVRTLAFACVIERFTPLYPDHRARILALRGTSSRLLETLASVVPAELRAVGARLAPPSPTITHREVVRA